MAGAGNKEPHKLRSLQSLFLQKVLGQEGRAPLRVYWKTSLKPGLAVGGLQGTKHRNRITMWSKVSVQSRVTMEQGHHGAGSQCGMGSPRSRTWIQRGAMSISGGSCPSSKPGSLPCSGTCCLVPADGTRSQPDPLLG